MNSNLETFLCTQVFESVVWILNYNYIPVGRKGYAYLRSGDTFIVNKIINSLHLKNFKISESQAAWIKICRYKTFFMFNSTEHESSSAHKN